MSHGGISVPMRPGHEKRGIWEEILWKERNPLIIFAFSYVVPFHHISPPSCAGVRACMRACIKALASHSGLFSCPSYISLSLPSPSLLHQPPCHLPLFSVCQSAFLPYLVFSPKVFRCITPPHASRYAKVTHLTRNTELCTAAVAPNLFSCLPLCHIRNMQLRFEKGKSTNCSVGYILPRGEA